MFGSKKRKERMQGRVIEALESAPYPMTTYDIATRIDSEKLPSHGAVYLALSQLVELGKVERSFDQFENDDRHRTLYAVIPPESTTEMPS